MGFQRLVVPFLGGGPDNKDCILGSILGSPYFGELLPCTGSQRSDVSLRGLKLNIVMLGVWRGA